MSDPGLEPRQLQDSLKSASPFLMKILEVILAVLCLGLILVPFDNRLQISVHRSGVVCVAFSLPVIANVIFLTSHFRRFPTPKSTLMSFSFVSGTLLLAASAILISDWWTFMRSLHFHPPKMFMDLMISGGVFGFFLALATFIDIYLTYLYY